MILRAAVWLVARTPLGLAWILAWCLAWVWWTVLPVRRAVAVSNLRACFPELAPGPALRRMMAELILGYVELLRHVRAPLPGLTFEGFEPLLARSRAGLGSLVLASHGGAWDLCGLATAQATGIPTTVIAKPPTSPAVAALIREIREGGGLALLPPRGSMGQVMEALTEGRVVIFFLDQRHNQGVLTPFFGRDALTAPSLAIAAARAGVPVFPVWQRRVGIGAHHVRLYPPFELSGDIHRDTAAFLCFVEEAIREEAHAWLWLHDRWRRP